MPNTLPTDDIYNQFGVSPNDYAYDPSNNIIKIKDNNIASVSNIASDIGLINGASNPLPVEQPTTGGYYKPNIEQGVNKLFGLNGQERYQTWPERMARSGFSLPADVYSGEVPATDPTTGRTSQQVIERAQDTAGLAGMSSIPLAPKGALGAIGGKFGMGESGGFYSTLENTIANSKVQKATPEQWLGPKEETKFQYKDQKTGEMREGTQVKYGGILGNLGVKPEELEFSGLGELPRGVPITKERLLEHVRENGIKLGEVWKGKPTGDQLEGLAQDMYRKPYSQLERWQQEEIANSVDEATKFSSYQLPGGSDYRELLLTKPNDQQSLFQVVSNKNQTGFDVVNKETGYRHYADLTTENEATALANVANTKNDRRIGNSDVYQSSHWDEPNVLAHIRMNDRQIPGVGKDLHIEEIQSDFMQAHRKEVMKIKEAINKDFDSIADRMVQAGVIKKICD